MQYMHQRPYEYVACLTKYLAPSNYYSAPSISLTQLYNRVIIAARIRYYYSMVPYNVDVVLYIIWDHQILLSNTYTGDHMNNLCTTSPERDRENNIKNPKKSEKSIKI
jgi:hypothetical protein